MAQLDVFQLSDGEWVVDIQSDLIDVAWTTVVVPLLPPDADISSTRRLNPSFMINGERRVFAVQFTGVVPRSLLSKPIATLASHEHEIQGSFDMLLSGI